METKTAVLVGATGLIGSYLLQELVKDVSYAKILVFTRKRILLKNEKIQQIVTDFKDEKFLKDNLEGDVLFCCLGTTIKKVGNQAAFRRIDHDLPVLLAEIAYANNFSSFLVISSIGAAVGSSYFYLKTKGEMEKDVAAYPFKSTIFFRPSILMGKRPEMRTGEAIGKIISGLLSPLMVGPLKNYRPVHGATVARAMVILSHHEWGLRVVESKEIEKIVKDAKAIFPKEAII